MNMELFNNNITTNIILHDGIVDYHGKVLNEQEAQYYLDTLLQTIEWKNDEAIIFGRHITTKRKVAWYADNGSCLHVF